MKPLLPQLFVATLAFCWVPLHAQDGKVASDITSEAKPFPQDLEEGAHAVFARLKGVSVPDSPREFIPFAIVRKLQPEQQAGKWGEYAVKMPGTKVEPDLHERVLRDFRQHLPRQLAAEMINAWLILYEESGTVYLIVQDGVGPEARFRAVRPKNLHELKLGDFKPE